jgi:hypothetical protein
MRVLSLDAGKNHFAYACIETTGESVSVTALGKLEHPIKDLTEAGMPSNVRKFLDEVTPFVEQADAVVFERVTQQPNRTMGSSVEYIGIAMGIITCRCADLGVALVPTMASTWKVKTKKLFRAWETSSELFDQPVLVKARKSNVISDHEFDALGIGLWFLQRMYVFEPLRVMFAEEVARILSERGRK